MKFFGHTAYYRLTARTEPLHSSRQLLSHLTRIHPRDCDRWASFMLRSLPSRTTPSPTSWTPKPLCQESLRYELKTAIPLIGRDIGGDCGVRAEFLNLETKPAWRHT